MENATVKLWAVRASGDDSFSERGEIAFDWSEMGDLTALNPDRESFRAKFDAAYPDENAASRSAVSGALYRLVYEMQIGDYVACLHGDTVSLGTFSGPYEFRDGAHRRAVNWLRHVPQASFSRDAMREMTCSPVRLFAVKRFAGEFLAQIGVTWIEPEPERPAAVKRSLAAAPDGAESVAALARPAATIKRTDAASATTVPAPVSVRACAIRAADYAGTDTAKFALDALRRSITREEFRQFVAGLLRAMGYTISLPPDGGLSEFEMTARRDELFPPVLVQLRTVAVEETDIARLRDAVSPGRYGLVVTLRDLSERAKQALKQAPYLRVVDGPELAALTLKYYCGLDERYRAMIPLRMVYVPAQ